MAGRGYLAYHLLAASWIMVGLLVDTRPGYLREPGVLGELVFLIVLYPLAIPALIMCGGPHNCGGSPLTILSVPVLLLTLIAAGSGFYLAFSFSDGSHACPASVIHRVGEVLLRHPPLGDDL